MDNPIAKFMIKLFTRIHIFLYRISGGKIWSKQLGTPVLLLTTTGNKSGKKRTTPVVYNREGDNYLISASLGGADVNPAWYYNIKRNGDATIEVGDQTFNCKTEILDGEERDTAYQIFKDKAQNFVQYEQRTKRVIPVIRLIPQS